jgi:hypothetical protein
MGRLHHLKETLPENLADNDGAVEFVVLDYNSDDGLEAWMQAEMASHVASGKVAYFRERNAKFFNPRHAKNIAHLLATGDILVNLDADNFTGPGYARKISEIFLQPGVYVRASRERPQRQTGIDGRLAFRREDFLKLRGYDEVCLGYGGDDPDISNRANCMGLERVSLVWPGERVIHHSNDERVKRFENTEQPHVSGKKNEAVRLSFKKGYIINPSGYGNGIVLRGFSGEELRVGVGLV